MFCTKCGNKAEQNWRFCNSCGYQLNGKNKKPILTETFISILKNQQPVKYIVICLATLLIIGITIIFVSNKDPVIDEASIVKAIDKYFSDNTDVYSGNESYYQESYNHIINSAIEALSRKSNINQDVINTTADSLSFSNESNMISLVDTVKSYSTYEVLNIEQKGDIYEVEVIVITLNIHDVNMKVWDEIISVNSVTDTILDILDRGIGSVIADLVRGTVKGDISFYLDEFNVQCNRAKNDVSYVGSFIFAYDKQSKAWEMIDFDKRLISAYYGVIN